MGGKWLQSDISLSCLLKKLPLSEGDPESCGAEHVCEGEAHGRGNAPRKATPAFLNGIMMGEWYQTRC